MKVSLVFEAVDGTISDKEGEAFQKEFTRRSVSYEAKSASITVAEISELFPEALRSRITISSTHINGRVYNFEKTLEANGAKNGTILVFRLAITSTEPVVASGSRSARASHKTAARESEPARFSRGGGSYSVPK